MKQIIFNLKEVKEAEDCLEEFVALAPKDPNQFILKYKILKEKNAPVAEQIDVLETFKKIEYVEKIFLAVCLKNETKIMHITQKIKAKTERIDKKYKRCYLII